MDVSVLIGIKDLNFPDQGKTWMPARLPIAPLPGDTLIVRHGDGEWTVTVASRTIRESASEGDALVLDCEGRFQPLG